MKYTENNSLKNKKVFITGGCGFIGSHLVKRLLSLNANIFLLKRPSTDIWRIKDHGDKISFFNGDITNPLDVDRCIKTIAPDYIFHLAAYGVDSAQKDYIKAGNINILGTLNIFNSLKYVDCKKIINMGSCAEYGDMQIKMKEDLCVKPSSIYGSTKACSTILSHQLAAENHIDIVTLRPFGIFGEGEEPHKFFSYIILSILKGQDVHLTPCQQYRDYCYVENIVDAMIMSAENFNLKNEILNVGTGTSKPLKYYVDMIYKLTNSSLKPQYGALAYRKNEMWNPCPDISKIKSLLGWSPKISLEEGLSKTIRWYEKNLSYYTKEIN